MMLIPSAYAQAAGAAAPAADPMGGLIGGIMPLLLIFVVFYFLMIRPQQTKVKKLHNAIAAVKKGDEVITAGGHIGKVVKVTDHEVEVEFGAGQKHRIVRATIAEVRPLGSKPAND